MKSQTELSYTNAAMECAKYIFDSDCEQISYQEYVQDGNDPRDHILYHAAVVLGETEDFQIDIDYFDGQI
jgi:hypothetical protein